MRVILILAISVLAVADSAELVCAFDGDSMVDAKIDSAANRDFKILTKIFVDGYSAPVSSNSTLFQKGLVFDFQVPSGQTEASAVTIYDSRNRKFVLLDLTRKVKLNLDSLQLLRIFDGMKKDLESNDRTKHLVSSEYSEKFDIDKMELVVENDFVDYRVIGERPKFDSILPRYHEFLDQYTFLTATDPERTPPIARIHLNRAIKKYGLMQKEVVRRVKENDFHAGTLRASKVSSRHTLEMLISGEDQAKIDLAKQHWMRFKEVDLAKYYEIDVMSADAGESKPLDSKSLKRR